MRRDGSVVFAVDVRTADLAAGDRVLAEAVRRRGVEVRPMVWATPCDPTDLVVIRSTWDYVERPAEFRSWLDELDAAGNTVVNPTALLRWNMHKGYLAELAARGVKVVPTEIVHAGSDSTLATVMEAHGWTRAVAKPAIGASARETFRVDEATLEGAEAIFRQLVDVEDVLVQPFLTVIESEGEVSVVAIDGEVTHAVAKRPATGEWRVQSEYGGSVNRVPVTAQHERAVSEVLAAFDQTPAYARVDLVAIDGVSYLMELELIEPELFFELAPDAADCFAERLVHLAAT
jgi:glutathione synthase/RimK-type ligase-like ATP-grasp enzyme